MSDSESSEEEGILKKAFDVELPDNFDPKKVPETGEEYLHHVIYERKQCKKWTRATIDVQKFQNNQTVYIVAESLPASTHINFIPSLEWQLKQQEDFVEFRKFIAFKREGEMEKEINRFKDWKDKIATTTPTYTFMANLRQSSLLLLLQIILEQMNEVELGCGLNENLCVWLYGVLATLEIPLNRDFYHYLRELVKKCLMIRSRLPEDVAKDMFVRLNFFICIIARVFGQLDLADGIK